MPEKLSAYAKGVMGENTACDYLLRQGMQFVDRRYRSPYGEIDLILRSGPVLVFAEVKARETLSRMTAQYAVTPAKQKRLIQTARCYLGDHPECAACVLRFDVITVAKDGILHIPDAFQGTEW